MRKSPALYLCAIICMLTTVSCMPGISSDTSLTLSESDHYYTMKARFSKKKMRKVEKYMQSKIGKRGNISFINMQSNATFTLADHTTFFMKKTPGQIEIKLDKDENSLTAYHRLKAMCEGLEEVLK